MFNKSLTGLVGFDVEQAKEICEMDDEVDQLKNQMKQQIKELLDSKNNNDALLEAFSIIHYLERVGDLSSNIAEEIIYIEEGEIIRHRKSLNKN